ncbi:MAG TPA: hypothetical protein VMU65_07915 [Candidatus Saccharimonadales bacterium]|nr:hypothetical protein [Candidatus Saccharimonadales bacterium]
MGESKSVGGLVAEPASQPVPPRMAHFTPLEASTNRSIGRDKPSTALGHGRFDKDALVKHRIELSTLEDDDIVKFIDARTSALLSLIAAGTGIFKIGT